MRQGNGCTGDETVSLVLKGVVARIDVRLLPVLGFVVLRFYVFEPGSPAPAPCRIQMNPPERWQKWNSSMITVVVCRVWRTSCWCCFCIEWRPFSWTDEVRRAKFQWSLVSEGHYPRSDYVLLKHTAACRHNPTKELSFHFEWKFYEVGFLIVPPHSISNMGHKRKPHICVKWNPSGRHGCRTSVESMVLGQAPWWMHDIVWLCMLTARRTDIGIIGMEESRVLYTAAIHSGGPILSAKLWECAKTTAIISN